MSERWPNRRDAYQEITDTIVALVAAGAGSCQMPWHSDGVPLTRPTNALTGQRYQGVNVLALWAASALAFHSSGVWATFKQWRRLGAHVRKGERGAIVVVYKPTEREVRDPETGEVTTETRLLARASWVFNADQVSGWQAPVPPYVGTIAAAAAADRFIAATGAEIRHGGDMACYRPIPDHIQMPDPERFLGTATSSATESYYTVLLHELTHWTGHPGRLGRDLAGRFGQAAYAMEELVAELGAAFLCADLGIANAPRPDHAAYIADWLEVLRGDKRAIFTAASRAGQAADYLASLQPQPANTSDAAPSSDPGPDADGGRGDAP